MILLKLIIRNTLRQRLRAVLTVTGMAVAILAFCLLRTVVDAWYAGVAGAAPDRLITRNAVSLIFTLPLSYRTKILQVPGVRRVAYASWFGGVYIDERHFFPRFVVGPEYYFDLFPEILISPEELKAFWHQRNACIVGRKLVEQYGWKPGDTVTLTGNIYPGEWRVVIRGVYRGATKSTDETMFLFRWDYLDEKVRQTTPSRAGQVGWYVVQVEDPSQAGAIAGAVDELFTSSLAETLTETEKAFQQSFVAMTEAIVIAIRIFSFVVIGVILMVLANTMAMSARERTSEYAVLKTLGFGNLFVAVLIAGESLTVAMLGGGFGMLLAFPVARVFSEQMGSFLPIFHISLRTLVMGSVITCAIGMLAAIFPIWRARRVRPAEALGHIG